MTITATGIRDLIVTKLGEVTSGTIGEVKSFPDGNFKNFPAASVKITGGRGQFLDTHRNERIFSFEIELYQEQSQAARGKESASDVMYAATDAILQAFDTDKDLGGEVEIVKVLSFTNDFSVRAGTFNFANFQVEVLVILPNS